MLFVHIGNRKSGSTTIQSFAFNNRSALADLGVVYSDIGLRKHKHRPLVDAAWNVDPDDNCLERLDAELRRDPSGRYLISAEELFTIKPRAIKRLLAHSGGHAVKAVAYVREYPEWIVSLYGHYVIAGYTTKDFDAFFDDAMEEVSVLPALQRWGDVMGAENVIVRSTNPASLHGGSLIADFLEAIQVQSVESQLPLDWPSANVAPSWPVIELCRALIELRLAQGGEAFDRRLRRSTIRDFEACLARSRLSVPSAGYLTRRQYETAASLYDHDVRVINDTFGSGIAEIGTDGFAGRPFLPTFDQVPLRLRRAFARRLLRRLVWSSIRGSNAPEYMAARRQVWRSLSRRYARR
jgi:hypothetical protein